MKKLFTTRGRVASLALAASAVLFGACSDFSTQPDALNGETSFNKKGGGTPAPSTATWTGNGATGTGASFTLDSPRCEESGGTPYLYWVLSAGGRNGSLDGATITIDGGSPASMSRVSKGSFKYTQNFSGDFVEPEDVTAAFTGSKSANLVLSHGCIGGEEPDGPSFKFILGPGVDPTIPFGYLVSCDPIDGTEGVLSDFTAEFTDICVAAFPANLYIPAAGIEVTGTEASPCVLINEGDDYACEITEKETIITIVAKDPGEDPSFKFVIPDGLTVTFNYVQFKDFDNECEDSGIEDDNVGNYTSTFTPVCSIGEGEVNVRFTAEGIASATASEGGSCAILEGSDPEEYGCRITAKDVTITLTAAGGGGAGPASFKAVSGGLVGYFPAGASCTYGNTGYQPVYDESGFIGVFTRCAPPVTPPSSLMAM
jgi:hypothetical protein